MCCRTLYAKPVLVLVHVYELSLPISLDNLVY